MFFLSSPLTRELSDPESVWSEAFHFCSRAANYFSRRCPGRLSVSPVFLAPAGLLSRRNFLGFAPGSLIRAGTPMIVVLSGTVRQHHAVGNQGGRGAPTDTLFPNLSVPNNLQPRAKINVIAHAAAPGTDSAHPR